MNATFISFSLAGDIFALDVHKVREVLEPGTLTRVPLSPDYVIGLLDVRERAIPIIDLRRKFGLLAAPPTPVSRILIMELSIDGRECVIGGLADSVLEVLEFDPSQIQAAPSIGAKWKPDLFLGIGRHGNEFIQLLDIEKVISAEELRAVMQTSQELSGAGES